MTRTNWVILFSTFAVFCTACSVVHAQPRPIDGPSNRVVFLEWLPMYSNTQMYRTLDSSLKAIEDISLERVSVYGSKEDLDKTLEGFQENPPKLVLAIGDFISQSVRKGCPDIPMVAVLVRDLEGLKTSNPDASGPFISITSIPDPNQVWDLAKEIKPEAKCLGIIHTDKYHPNLQLTKALAKTAEEKGFQVTTIKVNPGFCRTDSDFRKAIQEAAKKQSFDILYVPSDPNCDRFGSTIYTTATQMDIPSIGSETTIGKGCVAALIIRYAKVAEKMAKVIEQHFLHKSPLVDNFSIPLDVLLDANVSKEQVKMGNVVF